MFMAAQIHWNIQEANDIPEFDCASNTETNDW